jgi:hypothetical protein
MSVINWTDTVTPLNAANMNALEQVVRKGAANGYASLDANTRLPDAQTPARLGPVTGVVSDWNSALNDGWYGSAPGAANVPVTATYFIGFVANSHLGINYVRQTLYDLNAERVWMRRCDAGVWQSWVQVWPIAATALPPQAVPGYGTTLPASPNDGDEYIFVDNATNPTYQWGFRYHAASTSAYKWEFVGGRPAMITQGTSQALATATWQNVSPFTFAIPRAGEYRFEVTGMASSGSTTGTVQLGAYLGTPSSTIAWPANATINAGGWAASLAMAPWWTTFSAAQQLGVAAYANQAGFSINNHSLTILPLRVS